RDQHVREVECVWPGDLQLTFNTDVPDGDVVEQGPVFAYRVTVMTRVIRVVVHAVHGDTMLPRFPKVRRLPNAGIQHYGRIRDDRRRDVCGSRSGVRVEYVRHDASYEDRKLAATLPYCVVRNSFVLRNSSVAVKHSHRQGIR